EHGRVRAVELTEAAIPIYFGGMGAEHRWLRNHAAERGPTPADYEKRDTVTSLTMGVGSLVAPLVAAKLVRSITPGKGRFGKALVATAVTAAALTTIADRLTRLDEDPTPTSQADRGAVLGPQRTRARTRIAALARRVAPASG